jgi:hypothetical protein
MGDSKQSSAQFPPPQISDLLVLNLCVSAALMAISPSLRNTVASADIGFGPPKWRLVLPEVIEHLAFGGALFGLVVLARQRIRGSLFLSPGHLVFIAAGPWALMRLIVADAWRQVLTGETGPLRAIDDGLFVLAFGVSLIFTLKNFHVVEPRWRLFLVAIGAWLLLGAAWCILEVVESPWRVFRQQMVGMWTTAWLFAFIIACVLVVIDARRGIHRDWLHFSALAILGLISFSNLIHPEACQLDWWSDCYNYLSAYYRYLAM